MIAGIITVLVILLSQSFYQPVPASREVSKKDQKTERTDKHVSVAPSEVVPSTAVQLDKSTPDLLEILASEEPSEKAEFTVAALAVSFVKTFLRTAISPNAP